MRFIFMDEAGTSDDRIDERVRIVSAVILHADHQLLFAEAALDEALSAVPEEFRDGFVFHAEEVMNKRAYKDRWRLTDRVKFLQSVMSIPRRLKAPISFGLVWANAPETPLRARFKSAGDEHHFQAFVNAVAKADEWIRDHADHNEIGTIVAEQCDLKKLLGLVPSMLRKQPVIGRGEWMADRSVDKVRGFNSQSAEMRVTRIRSTVHFVGKDEDRLVWIADAIAYGLKRYFSDRPFGDEYCMAICGGFLNKPDFSNGPASLGLISPISSSGAVPIQPGV